jgi:hypothetical protein
MLGDFLNAVRRNHALEHATVTLLLARMGPEVRLVGRATQDGFYLYGNLPTELVRECAAEGLERLKRGEAFWAVTPLCGTNIATAGVLASLASMAMVGSGSRRDRLPNALMAGIVAVTLAQPLGRLIQKHVTTSPDLDGVQIVEIQRRGKGGIHKVRTVRGAETAAA